LRREFCWIWEADDEGRLRLVALYVFIKKTRTTRDEDLALARKRQKELEQ
jgi:phage-related protein